MRDALTANYSTISNADSTQGSAFFYACYQPCYVESGKESLRGGIPFFWATTWQSRNISCHEIDPPYIPPYPDKNRQDKEGLFAKLPFPILTVVWLK